MFFNFLLASCASFRCSIEVSFIVRVRNWLDLFPFKFLPFVDSVSSLVFQDFVETFQTFLFESIRFSTFLSIENFLSIRKNICAAFKS